MNNVEQISQLPDALKLDNEIIRNYEMGMSTTMKMTMRTSTSVLNRASFTARQARNFHAFKALKSSPYHYPEGPRSNLPFNPLTRFFVVRYWAFMAVGFCAPFGVAVWQTYKS